MKTAGTHLYSIKTIVHYTASSILTTLRGFSPESMSNLEQSPGKYLLQN